MSWTRRWTGDVAVAAAGLAGAIALAGWCGWRAWSISPIAPVAARNLTDELPGLRPRPATPAGLLRVAIASNPFRPEREPAPVAFRMPGEEKSLDTPVAPVELFLVGTAVLPEGRSFAMCRVGSEPPRVVRVGDQIGTYTLRRVEQGWAVFQTAQGSTLEVRVPKAGS